MSAERIAVCPGSFDPITRGHEDIIRRSFRMADRVIVAVAYSATQVKSGMFTVDERVEMIRETFADEPRVRGRCRSRGCWWTSRRRRGRSLIVRGLRAVSDFEYEFQMALMNRRLWDGMETVFLAPDLEHSYLSSSLVRQIASLGGDVSPFVPANVLRRLQQKFSKRRMSFLDTVHARAKANPRRIVLPEGADERTLVAAARLARDGLAHPTVLGGPEIGAELQRLGARGRGAGRPGARSAAPRARQRACTSGARPRGSRRTRRSASRPIRSYFGALLVAAGEVDGCVIGRDEHHGRRAARRALGRGPGGGDSHRLVLVLHGGPGLPRRGARRC